MADSTEREETSTVYLRELTKTLMGLTSCINWKPREQILIYGFGGVSFTVEYFLPMAKMYNSRIDGVDTCEQKIECAQALLACPGLQFYQADILDTDSPLHHKKFDKIFCFANLEFGKNYGTKLKKLNSILNRGGELALLADTNSWLGDLFEDFANDAKWRPYFLKNMKPPFAKWYGTRSQKTGEECLRKALKEAGFVISKLKTNKEEHILDLSNMTEYYASNDLFMNPVPKELEGDLRKAYRNGILKYLCKIENPENVLANVDVRETDTHIICIASKL